MEVENDKGFYLTLGVFMAIVAFVGSLGMKYVMGIIYEVFFRG